MKEQPKPFYPDPIPLRAPRILHYDAPFIVQLPNFDLSFRTPFKSDRTKWPAAEWFEENDWLIELIVFAQPRPCLRKYGLVVWAELNRKTGKFITSASDDRKRARCSEKRHRMCHCVLHERALRSGRQEIRVIHFFDGY